MNSDNIIQQKSFEFAIHVINICKFLQQEKKEFTISKQFVRSGTSIGANIEESIGGQSEKDFLSKISIAYKEARETIYWIKLLRATDFLSVEQETSLLHEAEELARILGKIQITLRKRFNND